MRVSFPIWQWVHGKVPTGCRHPLAGLGAVVGLLWVTVMLCLYWRHSGHHHITVEPRREVQVQTDVSSFGADSASDVGTYRDSAYCKVRCHTGRPCEYRDQLDFRVIVLAYDRPDSLRKCLKHIGQLDTLNDRVGVDVWIDRSQNGAVAQDTVQVARDFVSSWKGGRGCVHIQGSNAHIAGQWIDTWRPKPNTREQALIIEDDIDISRHSYSWLKAVNGRYRNHSRLAGYTIHMEDVIIARPVPGDVKTTVSGPTSDSVYFYELMSTWGFVPQPDFWRGFQRWYHIQVRDPAFSPYVPGIQPTDWYKAYEARGSQSNMWEMWFLYYCFVHDRWTLYPNFIAYTGRKDVLLLTNRYEAGLHYPQGLSRDHSDRLLKDMDAKLLRFPDNVTVYGYDGSPRPISDLP